jgi:hypothetical protein
LLELESILVNYVRHRGLAMRYFKIIIELDYCSITDWKWRFAHNCCYKCKGKRTNTWYVKGNVQELIKVCKKNKHWHDDAIPLIHLGQHNEELDQLKYIHMIKSTIKIPLAETKNSYFRFLPAPFFICLNVCLSSLSILEQTILNFSGGTSQISNVSIE